MDNQAQRCVLVTDASRGSAISIIRSLGRKGLRVIAADSIPGSLGFHSRYTSVRLVYPSPEAAPMAYAEAVLEAVRQYKVDLVIPVTDAAILPLVENRDRFEQYCQLAVADPDALEVTTNKLKTVGLAQDLGVPTPVTRLVHTVEEALRVMPEFSWPIVLKPMVSRKYLEQKAIESYTVAYARDADDLAGQMRRFEGRCPILLQEYTPGVGVGVELAVYRGNPVAVFQHKRLREVPINGGASALRESVAVDPQLLDYSARLMHSLCWTGLAMVEFKVGPGGPKLMEINGRVWGSLSLAVLSGMDFPAHLVDLYFGKPPSPGLPPRQDYRVGVRARNLELDVMWILTVLNGKKRYPFLPMPERKHAVAAVLELFNPTYRFDILSLHDLQPGLMEIGKIIRKVSTKMKEAG